MPPAMFEPPVTTSGSFSIPATFHAVPTEMAAITAGIALRIACRNRGKETCSGESAVGICRFQPLIAARAGMPAVMVRTTWSVHGLLPPAESPARYRHNALMPGDDQNGRDDGRQCGIRRNGSTDVHQAQRDHFQSTADDNTGFHVPRTAPIKVRAIGQWN